MFLKEVVVKHHSISKDLLYINRSYHVPRLLLEYLPFNFWKSSKQEISKQYEPKESEKEWPVLSEGLQTLGLRRDLRLVPLSPHFLVVVVVVSLCC